MRLVNAALFRRGGRLQSTTQGRLDCAELVIQPYLTQEPKVVLPCNGDRVFGMAQDTEVAFGFPWSLADELLEGLEATHRGGVRYPIPVAMRATPVMPERYRSSWQPCPRTDPAGATPHQGRAALRGVVAPLVT